ncbi:DUF3592 domain-containing protein [Pseudoxanthomonas sp. Root630]|uniref:DUF3592 domain-containing protein n=1 Tax=Pseudoxanthomonas sp. Root630 TaxID=1736574 RepID=UPI000AA401E8|nr:DUF3592 domain-containing protein [Pseudoxanthomonas sp. Root630]
MTMTGFLVAAGGVACGVALLAFLRARTARTWPSAPARVVEVPPQSWFEDLGHRQWGVNTDTDHVLVWTVGGLEYRKRVEDRAAVQVAGLKLWRRAPLLEEIVIRYDPRNPGTGLTPEDIGAWRWLVAISAAFFAAAAFVHLF